MESGFEEITQLANYQIDRPEVIDRRKLKSEYVPYRPISLVAVNGNRPFNILIPREDVFADLRDSYPEIETQIVKNADDTLYADNDGIQPNNLFGISLLREMTLSEKLETGDHVYLASLMYKLLSDNEEEMMIIYRN